MADNIRPAGPADLAPIKQIAVDTGLFAPDEVAMFDEMLAGYLDGSMEDHRWLVLTDGPHDGDPAPPIGAAYYAPEPFSDRLWNLYFLGVSPDHQGHGAGATLIDHIETSLRAEGEDRARVLIVETSGTPAFEPTRRFYRDRGFDKEAVIRQFYGPTDDKVVYWKLLADQ